MHRAIMQHIHGHISSNGQTAKTQSEKYKYAACDDESQVSNLSTYPKNVSVAPSIKNLEVSKYCIKFLVRFIEKLSVYSFSQNKLLKAV